MAARHITVFADWMQQIFEDGAKENQIQEILNIKKEDITMLGAYRNSPYVAQLASYFVMDERRRREYLSQIKIPRLSFERPLYYVATDHIDELNRLAEVVRQRQQLNQRVGLIVTKNKQVEELAAGLWSRGVKVEKAVSPRKQKLPVSFNFNNNVPKIATYHSAKGLTFDSVLLPSLTVRAFSHTRDPNLRRRMLFVGIARATQWVYLSTIKREEVEEFSLLKDAAARNHLTYQDGEVGRPGKKGSFIDDDFDSPL
uniref:3'-5' exonuclease n=1 Tax=Candidatus Saccharicenans sp. TaxID=2819258 RepID=UPI004049E564